MRRKAYVEPYQGTDRTVEAMEQLIAGPHGELSLELRAELEDVIRHLNPRDRLSQLAAVYNWFRRRYHFVRDPLQIEHVKTPRRMLREIQEHGRAVGDCDDASTFMAAAARLLGIPAGVARTSFVDRALSGREGPFTHVLALGVDQFGRSIVVDPVAGPRARKMLSQIKQVKKSAIRKSGTGWE